MDEPIGSLADSIAIDRDGPIALSDQITQAIEEQVAAGLIGPGVRLPAERELAAALGVNRATVGRAYRRLGERGLASSRVGSGTVIVAGEAPASTPAAAVPAANPTRPLLSRGIRELARAARPPHAGPVDGAIDFALMLPDVALFPRARLARAVEVAIARGAEVLQYGSPMGLPSLRQALAERLNRRGIAAGADEVLVVNGIQQALDLLAKVLLEPGDAVVVESPTYANVLPLLKLYGAETIGVPIEDEGIDTVQLEKVLAAHHPKLLYTIPTFHNPTGVTMSLARRQALLAACRAAGTVVVEDGYEEDLRYAGAPLPSLAALDSSEGVVHLGTFSKGLFPGLRLGFLVARGELLAMLTLAKRYSDYHADLLSQAVLAEILVSGDYDRHLERLRRTYRERFARTLKAMSEHFPAGLRWCSPEGGYTTWVSLPDGVRATAIAEEARRQGVLVLAGHPFFEGPTGGESGFRLSISRTDPDRIEEGISRLGQVLRDALARSPETHQPEAVSLV